MTQPSPEEDKNQVYLEKRLEEEENERQIILQQKLLNQIVLEKIHSSYPIQVIRFKFCERMLVQW